MTENTRQILADAVNTVDAITCTPGYRQTVKAGEAMVRFAGLRRDASGFGYMNTWQIVLTLPQQLSASEAFVDQHLDALLEAVEPVLIVTTAEPRELVLDNAAGTVPVLVVEGTRPRA